MSAHILGNLRVDAPTDVARTIVARLARLTVEEGVGHVLLDRWGNVQLVRPAMRDCGQVLQERADELVGTYTRCVSSPAMLELIAGDLAEAMK